MSLLFLDNLKPLYTHATNTYQPWSEFFNLGARFRCVASAQELGPRIQENVKTAAGNYLVLNLICFVFTFLLSPKLWYLLLAILGLWFFLYGLSEDYCARQLHLPFDRRKKLAGILFVVHLYFFLSLHWFFWLGLVLTGVHMTMMATATPPPSSTPPLNSIHVYSPHSSSSTSPSFSGRSFSSTTR